jgi:outer membrane receptor protein involved in Fe transport
MLRNVYIIAIGFILFATSLSSYSQTVSGVVVDRTSNPIPGAYVVNQRGHVHTHTNVLGQFTIGNTASGDSLAISCIGFDQLFVLVSDNGVIRVVLTEATVAIGQVQITTELDVMSQIAAIELETNPVSSSQEILRRVPGLFVAQHAGGGKAEQIFLRGFDVDHGTDVSVSVDGMPVNMVSHAHGQGYADLHFLIPQTVERIEFDKGPYYAEYGDFTTAGYVNFVTRDKIDENVAELEVGMFNSYRALALVDVLPARQKADAYLAAEITGSDGAFESPQNFQRINVFGKTVFRLGDRHRTSLSLSHFTSDWSASGQIPQRAVDAGLISRWGSIDNTEGGETSRSNLILSHQFFIDDQSLIKVNFFSTRYLFDLFSNFTFYAADSVNGDQIEQSEGRWLNGGKASYCRSFGTERNQILLNAALGLRSDHIGDIGLWRTKMRSEPLSTVQDGAVQEDNYFGYVDASWSRGHWRVNSALRYDHFLMHYTDRTSLIDYAPIEKGLLSPKLGLVYSPNHDWQLYVKLGKGFHSNDARALLTGGNSLSEALPAAYGADVGMLVKATDKVIVNLAFWHLALDQEFVYVGDEGIVEPSGATVRKGLDIGIRFQPYYWLMFTGDVTYSHARSVELPSGEQFVPLAAWLTTQFSATCNLKSGWSAGLHTRHLADRPADETNTIKAKGYLVADAVVGYSFKRLTVSASLKNLFNTEWKETQFLTTSRLLNEPEPVSDIHFTPGMPFTLSGRLKLSF